jgi:hypothetical protein
MSPGGADSLSRKRIVASLIKKADMKPFRRIKRGGLTKPWIKRSF